MGLLVIDVVIGLEISDTMVLSEHDGDKGVSVHVLIVFIPSIILCVMLDDGLVGSFDGQE